MAIAYHLQKQPFVFPCVGGYKPEQLLSNLDALKIVLTEDHIKEIESVLPFDVGYPNIYIVSEIQTFVFAFMTDCWTA